VLRYPAAFLRVLLLALVVMPWSQSAHATDIWAVVSGDPCCGIPDELFKYLDADTACVAEVPLPAESQCKVNYRDMRNAGGPQNHGGGCIYDVDCICGDCLLASGPHTMTQGTGRFAYRKSVTSCPAGMHLEFGRCKFDPPKGKGCCTDTDLALANPVNIASGNKYQAEKIYAAQADGLQLTLFYNSDLGDPYFQSGAFGRQWSSRYTARIKNTFQGIIAVSRGNGRELEFRQPSSGTLYLRVGDLNDRLERINDGAGVLVGWRYTAAEGDEVEEYTAAGCAANHEMRAWVS
jgi:hypothetical protein